VDTSDDPDAPDTSGNLGYVLVIGDEDPQRVSLEEALLANGLAVATATAHETMGIPDLTPPRLIALHDNLGGSGLFGLLRQLQNHRSLVGVPIVVLGREGAATEFSAAIASGAAAYLTRPVETEELLAAVRRLSGWRGRGHFTEKRRRVRRPLLMPVTLEVKASGAHLPGEMLDASTGGCRLEVASTVKPGEAVKVRLQPQDMGSIGLTAEVRWVCPTSDGRHEVGVRFTGTSAILAGKVLGLVLVSGLT
jgi:CheY-like chemotaxis protein